MSSDDDGTEGTSRSRDRPRHALVWLHDGKTRAASTGFTVKTRAPELVTRRSDWLERSSAKAFILSSSRSDDYDGAAAHAAPHEMGLLVRPVLLIPPVPTIAPVAFSLKKASFDRYGTCRTSWGC